MNISYVLLLLCAFAVAVLRLLCASLMLKEITHRPLSSAPSTDSGGRGPPFVRSADYDCTGCSGSASHQNRRPDVGERIALLAIVLVLQLVNSSNTTQVRSIDK